jgi:hypothetical protein
MIADLRADSARWRQEQRQTGTRGSHSPIIHIVSGITVPDAHHLESYVGSSTYNASSASRTVQNRRDGGDSPSLEGPYGLPPSSRDRIPVDTRMDTRMQIDPPQPQSRVYPSDSRAPFQPDGRAFPSENRGYAPESRSSYQPDAPMASGFGGRPPATAAYGQEPRYAPSYPPASDGAPPGYVRQGNYFVPITQYEPAPSIPSRSDPYGPSGGYGGQPQQRNEPRDPRDPRYGQPEYADPRDPRYAYPSPAATVSSVAARDRDPITAPQQPRFAS